MFLYKLLTVLIFAFGTTSMTADLLSKSEFTKQAVELFRKTYPNAGISEDRDLGFSYDDSRRGKGIINLDNAFAVYIQNPNALNDILQKYIAVAASPSLKEIEVDSLLQNLFPAIRPRAFVSYADSLNEAKPAGKLVSLQYCHDLFLTFGIDSPDHFRYLSHADTIVIGKSISNLEAIAIGNLAKKFPQVTVNIIEDAYMMVADGTYESTLLLLDYLWNQSEYGFSSDIVVAIPSRDVLAFTEDTNARGLIKLQEIADDYFTFDHAISPHLYVRRDGNWMLFQERNQQIGGSKK